MRIPCSIRPALSVFVATSLFATSPVGGQEAAPEGGKSVVPPSEEKLEPTVVGEWVATFYGEKEVPEGERTTVFRFGKDGSVVRSIAGVEKAGTFRMSEDGGSIVVTSQDKEEILEIEGLTGEILDIVIGDERVKLSRLPVSQEEADGRDLSGEIVGRWQLSKLGDEPVEEDGKTTFSFSEDGKVVRLGRGSEKKGTYSLSADKAILTMVREGAADGDVLDVLELTETTFRLKEGERQMELSRIATDDAGGDPEVGERPKDGEIYGRWKVVAMEGLPEGADKPMFQFNKDGTVTGSFGERVKHGSFKLAADRSTLTMMDMGKSLEEGDTAAVVELSDTVLELSMDGAMLRMERVGE